ncbi:MAG: molybdopterin-dependent oxidoreductase [Candidatus Lokiarchaeota archaeon]|nr:molybdopterin-dependent oxidoreductase [Candidatus Lokiarchaeota archaeon]
MTYPNKDRVGTCTKDCYGSCVFKGIWNDEALEQKLLSAQPLKEHPFTNGFFCPKYKKRESLLYHQKRVKTPLLRIGAKSENNFEKITLEKAFEIITKKLIEIQKKSESTSILGAFYTGNCGLISQYAPLRFFREIGATITNGGICNEGGCAGLTELFGTYSTTNPFQLINPSTRLIVIWGSNLSETNNHAYYLVKQALKRGTKVVVIDSRRTPIAKKADLFLHIFPGTDHLLVKMVLNKLVANKIYDELFLNDNVDSYSSIFLEVAKVEKVKLLEQIGIKIQTFQNFVDFLFKFKHQTLFNIGYGVQKDFHGGRIVKSIALIQILLGNIGKPGTGLIYSQSDFLKPLLQPLQDYITSIKKRPKMKEIPIIELGSALLSGTYKMLIVYNFNPASSLPNQNLLRTALMNDDLFIIVLDMFLNETTKYANIVIPAKFDLESHDIISPFYIPGLSINIGGPCPYQDCVSNYEFFQQLALKMGYDDKVFQESEESIFKNCLKMLPLKIQESIDKLGYYLLFDFDSVPFNNLKFPTSNNQIQAKGPHFKFGENELKRKFSNKINEFLLISPSHFYFLHSQLGQVNIRYLDEFSKIFLTPEDIEALGLKTGDKVLVSNEYYTGVYILAELPILKHGTALIYSGLSSTLKENLNVNHFTPDKPEELGFSGAYNSTLVKITEIKSKYT